MAASVRNNNPGAMKYASWQTAFGGTKGSRSPDGTHYARFPSPAAGFAAAAQLQRRYEDQGRTTLADRVAKWTAYQGGGSDSATKAQYQHYITALSNAMGIDPNTPFSIDDPNLGPKYLATMAEIEAGYAQPFAPEELQAGLDMAKAGQGTANPTIALQQALKAAGFDPGPVDGEIGPQTETAAQAYLAAGLPPLDIGVAANGPSLGAAAPNTGAMGADEIKSIQSDLASLGFYKGKIDGVAGPQTTQAMQGVSHYLGIPDQGQAMPGLYHELALNADPWHGNVVSPEAMAYVQDDMPGDMNGPNFLAEGGPPAEPAVAQAGRSQLPGGGPPPPPTFPATFGERPIPAMTGSAAAGIAPPTAATLQAGIAPKAGPFFDWSQRQQPPPAVPLGSVQMALPTARPSRADPDPLMSPSAAEEPASGSETLSRKQMQDRYGWTPQASDAVFPSGTEKTGEGQFVRAVLGGDPGEMKAGYANVWSPSTLTKIFTNLSEDQVNAAKANIYNNHGFMSDFAFGQFKEKAGPVTPSKMTLPTMRPTPPASVFTAKPQPFFNWSQIQQPASSPVSAYAGEPKSSPALAAVAAVGSGSPLRYVLSDGASRAAAPWTSPSAASDTPRYGGGGGGIASAPWSSPSAASGYASSAAAAPSKSYNAGAPVQSSYNVLSSANTGKASTPAASPSGDAAPAASATPVPSSVAGVTFGDAPGFMSAEDTKNAFGDAAGHLAAATSLVAPPASAPPASHRVGGPAMGVTPRVAVKTFSAPIGGRYVQNPAPANPSMSQKLAAALGSMSAAQKAGYTTSRASDLAGLAAQGYTMPNYSAGSGGSTYAYNRNVGGTATDVHGNQVNVGTYYNSAGTPMTYQWSANGAP